MSRIRHPEVHLKPGPLMQAYLNMVPEGTQETWHEYLAGLFSIWQRHIPWASNGLKVSHGKLCGIIVNRYGKEISGG
jgi:hypothetical protein